MASKNRQCLGVMLVWIPGVAAITPSCHVHQSLLSAEILGRQLQQILSPGACELEDRQRSWERGLAKCSAVRVPSL